MLPYSYNRMRWEAEGYRLDPTAERLPISGHSYNNLYYKYIFLLRKYAANEGCIPVKNLHTSNILTLALGNALTALLSYGQGHLWLQMKRPKKRSRHDF